MCLTTTLTLTVSFELYKIDTKQLLRWKVKVIDIVKDQICFHVFHKQHVWNFVLISWAGLNVPVLCSYDFFIHCENRRHFIDLHIYWMFWHNFDSSQIKFSYEEVWWLRENKILRKLLNKSMAKKLSWLNLSAHF